MEDNSLLYRSNDFSIYNQDNAIALCYNWSGDFYRFYSIQSLVILNSCNEFKTIEQHAYDIVRSQQIRSLLRSSSSNLVEKLQKFLAEKIIESRGEIPVSSGQVHVVKQQLEMFSRHGFLVSKKELEDQLSTKVSSTTSSLEGINHSINKICIPTRNRSDQLIKCVSSFINELPPDHSRSSIYIVDGSDPDVQSNGSQEAIHQLCNRHNVELLWADRSYRKTLASKLAGYSNVPTEIVEFALLGDPRCDNHTGACRNTLLLLSTGNPSLQVDDDIFCKKIPSPDKVDGIALTSSSSCFKYQFVHSDKQPWPNSTDNTGSNFFSIHEELLGKHPAELLKNEQVLNIDTLDNQLLEKIGDPKSRIVTTFTGVYGDSGMFRHWQRLCLEGESFRQLTDDPSSYRDYLCTRQLLRVPSQVTIGDSPFCMAGVIGLDTRDMLPPFMPVQRNQDGVFGKLLHLNFKQALQGYIPWAVHHQPPHRASHVKLSHALHVGPLRVSDILIALISSLEWPFGSDSNVNLNTTGSYLNDLSRLPTKNFKAHTLEACWKMCRKQVSYLNFCLDDRPHAPEYWKKDVQQVLSNFQLLMQREDASTPCDLDGNSLERLELFQELVGKFGQLLIYWPTIWKASRHFNEKFSSVGQINGQ